MNARRTTSSHPLFALAASAALAVFSAAHADEAPKPGPAAVHPGSGAAQNGDPNTLGLAAAMLLIHHARLEAELKGAAEITLPNEIKSLRGIEPVARAVRDEQLTFETHRDALASQLQGLTEAQTLAQCEIEILDKKNEATKRQVAQFQRQLDQITPLVARGTLSVPQRLTVEQTLTQLETAQLDIEFAILKVHQEESAVKRAIEDLRRQSRSDALVDLNQTRSQLAVVLQQMTSDGQN
jgi:polysaccharide biosynthesis/export protein ExoF